jgi:hypothetical protein
MAGRLNKSAWPLSGISENEMFFLFDGAKLHISFFSNKFLSQKVRV